MIYNMNENKNIKSAPSNQAQKSVPSEKSQKSVVLTV
jgi:hypothetical protein